MNRVIKREALILLFLVLPFILIVLKWNDFPDPMPIHFNAEGQPDDYTSKGVGLLMLPILNILMYVLFLFVPKMDPQKKNYEKFADTFKLIRTAIHLFMTFIFMVIAAYSLGYTFNVGLVVVYAVLLLLLVFGNYMRTVRHNYFVGIRTPWTLANEKVWTKTHRFAAGLWVAASVIMMVVLPFVSQVQYILLIYIAIIVMLPVAHSYITFTRLRSEENNL